MTNATARGIGITPVPRDTPARGASALRVESVTKAFGATVANRAMSLDLRVGEVHGLLGQNGAGKSTLVSILTGHTQPDSGRVVVFDRNLDLHTAERAIEAGIVAVYQTLMLVPSMTGLENVALALGRAPGGDLRASLEALADRYGLPLTLDVPVEFLDMAARQRIEFARALSQQPQILLLDEPTTFLPPTQIDDFLATVRRLADSGLAVLLITHHLEEARRICDRVTVIRAGHTVAEYDRDTFPDNHDLAVAMLGESVEEPTHDTKPGRDVVLSASALATAHRHGEIALCDVDLDVHAGEIVGIAGVDGNGQIELVEAIAGARPATGTVRLGGADISSLSFAARARRGICLLSSDRREHGVIPGFSVYDHFEFALGHQTRPDVLRRLADHDVRPLDLDVALSALSGGNQQKVLFARAIASSPTVLLAAYPTQGLDVSAAARVHAHLQQHAATGLGVVVVSSDLDELLALCDRIVVMYRGRVVGTQRRGEVDRRLLARWFTGVEAA